MTHTSSSHLLTVALLGLAVGYPAREAHAEGPPVQFVGVQRGCERDGQLDHAVERRMFQRGTPVALVRTPAGKPLPPCFGERCGQWFRQSCPTSPGRVLGGSVVQGKDLLQVRLWLYDLQSGQTAYQDEYCQGCDIVSALSTQAARLIASPSFGPAPGPTPSYCTASATAPAGSRPSVPAGPLLLTVFGEGKHRPALLLALKQQLALLGYKVDPLPIEAGKNAPDMKKLVAGQRNARVLGLEVPKEGKLQLFLYDQKTEQTEGKLLECEDCDKEAIIAKVQPEVATVMEHCFGDACSAGNPAAVPPPSEACSPFPDPSCGASDTASASSLVYAMPPRTGKIIKGITWGAVAVSALSSVSLFAANAAGVGNVTVNGVEVDNRLVRPAYAVTAATALFLGIAIPLTLLSQSPQSPTTASPSAASPTIQCPQ